MELQVLEKGTYKERQVSPLKNKGEKSSIDKSAYNFLVNDIAEEGGVDLVKYFEKFNLIQDSNCIILSSKRHYFYDTNELKRTNNVINLNLLNYTSQITPRLQTLSCVLPENGLLAGCFIDFHKQKMHKITSKSRYLNMFLLVYKEIAFQIIPKFNLVQAFLNKKALKYLTANEASKLLNKSGFQVIDMTEINGFTYFVSKKINHSS